jgi:NAD(P)-dependent dehydrogenase (short-subunit alcohol dehydrogenase family)
MDLDLTAKTALVTGSTRGIGFATALALAGMGARVVVNGRTQAPVSAAVGRIRDRVPGADLDGVAADLATAGGCDRVAAAHPQIDILVNNLGIYEFKPFEEIPDEEWLHYFEVNVMSGVRMARHYLPGMLARDWGRVVFVSSESGVFIPPEMIHYGFSKAAQLAVSRGLAETTVGTRVTVNAVLPGPTWVETHEERVARRAAEEGRTVDEVKADFFRTRRPTSLLRRYATPDEVANMIAYVCSPAASATNGAALRVEGGIVRTMI